MELIEVDNLRDDILNNSDYDNDTINHFLDIVDSQPTVDVEPVRRGKWILERKQDGTPYCFHCSVCDNDFHHIGIEVAYDYCPNCGAKMEEFNE